LFDTYLPAFRAAVTEGGAGSVMCAYNRYLGEACCASPRLEKDILRKDWGFRGYIVSDCGAIDDIYQGHQQKAPANRSGLFWLNSMLLTKHGLSLRGSISSNHPTE
jgi:beta-glucosidase